ncbi:MAG TPA: hypothetical protein VII06_14515 [Chloroflexota bacterium]|jgi:hypothetical protein
MTLVVSSLQTVGRVLLRLYASDLAYEAGMLLAIGLFALTLTLGAMQHLPPQQATAPVEPPDDVCWVFDSLCP